MGRGLISCAGVKPYGLADRKSLRTVIVAAHDGRLRPSLYRVCRRPRRCAPTFLHEAGGLGLHVVARPISDITANQHCKSFLWHGPRGSVERQRLRPWRTLRWKSVRKIVRLQHEPAGRICISPRSYRRIQKKHAEIGSSKQHPRNSPLLAPQAALTCSPPACILK